MLLAVQLLCNFVGGKATVKNMHISLSVRKLLGSQAYVLLYRSKEAQVLVTNFTTKYIVQSDIHAKMQLNKPIKTSNASISILQSPTLVEKLSVPSASVLPDNNKIPSGDLRGAGMNENSGHVPSGGDHNSAGIHTDNGTAVFSVDPIGENGGFCSVPSMLVLLQQSPQEEIAMLALMKTTIFPPYLQMRLQ